MSIIEKEDSIPEEHAGKRLDWALAQVFNEYSRSQLQDWLAAGQIKVAGIQHLPAKHKVKGGEWVVIEADRPQIETFEPENIPLNIVYEDEAILVINKPPNFVVHPGAGQYSGTLLNALLYHDPVLSQVPRAGIIHRLDKDTTGLMVIAKSIESQFHLTTQLKNRSVRRIYHAYVWGQMLSGFTASEPLGRHPKNRLQMSVQPEGAGKEAMTHFRVLKKWEKATCVEARLETGRTHQIRVHLAHHRYPVMGDPLYGAKSKDGKIKALIARQALHAKELSLIHPLTGEECHFETELPQDMKNLMTALSTL
jgi:23S rRNA pseudouridine1911/1915/1917 synthase